jgi:hypothetical protein
MAPVAALIVVRPCIEVNAVEGDSLDADAQGGDEWAHFPVETVLVHAEVGGGVAHADEAGEGRGVRGWATGLWALGARDFGGFGIDRLPPLSV